MTAPHPAPNPRLIETVSHLSPGQALELGCGNGGDAIWLAENRWTVTAVDISTAATDRLTHLADETGLKDRITAIPWDLTRGLPEGEFDLVNTHYLHTHSPLDRVTVFRAAAGALRPGGHLLIVDHGSTAPWSWNQDPKQDFPTPQQVYAEIALESAGWELERAEALQRLATGPGGQRADVIDHILMIRRTSS